MHPARVVGGAARGIKEASDVPYPCVLPSERGLGCLQALFWLQFQMALANDGIGVVA